MKHYYTLLAACVLLFSGCSETFVDQGATPPQPTNPDGRFEARIHAGASTDDATRAVYDGAHVRWEVGDQIGLTVGENSNIEFTLVEETLSEDARSADFTGLLTHEVTGVQDVWAAYPSRGIISSSEMIVPFPREQYTSDNIQDIPIALAHYRGDVGEGLEHVNLQFYNPLTTLKLEIAVDAETTFYGIVFHGNNGEQIPYMARFVLSESGAAFDSSYVEGVAPSSHIKVNCADHRVAANSTATFYITVPPIDYSEGYRFDIVTDRGMATQIKPSRADYTSKANTVLSLPAFTLDPQPSSTTVVIPDAAFRKFMFNEGYIDQNAEGPVQITPQGLMLTELSFHGLAPASLKSLEGIAAFPNLALLNIAVSAVTTLDVSGCAALEYLACWNTPITTLDVTGCSLLKELVCYETNLTTLDVTGCPALKVLVCNNTSISSLDVAGNPALGVLGCWNTLITTLDVTGCPKLFSMRCDNCRLSELDMSNMAEFSNITEGIITLLCGDQKDESGNPRELTLTAPAWLSKYWSDGTHNWGSLPENQGVVLK